MTETTERDRGVEKLKARCHVYELERQALLKIINDMCGLLYDKYRQEDAQNKEQNETEVSA